ncbi:SUKH-4 family immunity protein [Yinghuangia aomiensis]
MLSIQNELIKAYGAYRLHTAAEVPDSLVDRDARRLVCEIGVPRGLMEAITLAPNRMKSVAAAFGFLDSHRALPDRLLCIGYIGDDALILDGATGAVGAIATREGAQPIVVNGHLSMLVRCMAVVESRSPVEEALWMRGPAEERAEHLTRRLEAVDPVVAEPGSKWHTAIRIICRDG